MDWNEEYKKMRSGGLPHKIDGKIVDDKSIVLRRGARRSEEYIHNQILADRKSRAEKSKAFARRLAEQDAPALQHYDEREPLPLNQNQVSEFQMSGLGSIITVIIITLIFMFITARCYAAG